MLRHLPRRLFSALSKPRVAVLGVGQIGAALLDGLSRSKVAGKVVCYDVAEKNRKQAEASGAIWSSSVEAAVEGAQVLITALPTPMHVQKLMSGTSDQKKYGHYTCDGKPGAALMTRKLLKTGTLWVDHTTVSPQMARKFAALSQEGSIRMVEAPLTGGHTLLKAGQMTVFLGGKDADIADCMPLVKSYTTAQIKMGAVGTAAVVKIISNQLAGAHQLLAGEGAALARAQGVDLEAFFHGIRVSAGNSFALETELPLMFNRSFQPGFEVGLHIKDLEIGHLLAQEKGIDEEKALPLLHLTRKYYEEAGEKYGMLVGSTSPSRLVEERTGIELGVKGYDNWSYEVARVDSKVPCPAGVVVLHKGVEDKKK